MWGVGCGLAALGHGEELDGKAEVFGVGDVGGGDGADAFAVDLGAIDAAPVGKAGKDGDLVGGIEAVHIGGGIGFGVAEGLGIGEDIGEVTALMGHAGEDVVGGAVDDAGDAGDAVGAEGLLEGLDDGDAAADGSFEQDVDACFFGGGEEFVAVEGDRCFIGSNHMLAMLNSFEHEAAGGFEAADDFNDDVDVGVGDDGVEIGGEAIGGEVDVAGLVEGADADFGDL